MGEEALIILTKWIIYELLSLLKKGARRKFVIRLILQIVKLQKCFKSRSAEKLRIIRNIGTLWHVNFVDIPYLQYWYWYFYSIGNLFFYFFISRLVTKVFPVCHVMYVQKYFTYKSFAYKSMKPFLCFSLKFVVSFWKMCKLGHCADVSVFLLLQYKLPSCSKTQYKYSRVLFGCEQKLLLYLVAQILKLCILIDFCVN